MPTSTPRDVDTILDSMDETTRNVDPAIDTRKGPLSVMYYAHAIEMSRTESLAAYLQSVWQLENADALEDEDIFQLGNNYGLDANIGKAAKVLMHLFRFARPDENDIITADAGTLVSTDDGRFVFATLDEVSMDGNFADAFFNVEEQRYEIGVEAVAVAVGDDYNLPPNTIIRFISQTGDWDGVVNKDFAKQGTDPLDKTQFRNLIWDRLQGINLDIAGSMLAIIQDTDPLGFDDISIVSSQDFENFTRFNSIEEKIGYDVYLISDATSETTQTFTALGGETFIPLERSPIQAVRFVAVDGAQTAFSVALDTTSEFVGSPLANDGVTLDVALLPAQVVEINYSYFSLVNEGHDALAQREGPFGSDTLVRLANQVQILIAGKIKAFSTADREDVIQELRDFTEGFLRDPEFPSTTRRTFVDNLDPFIYQQAAEASIDGLQEFAITRFVRLDRAFLDVELITLDAVTEYPVLFPEFDIS